MEMNKMKKTIGALIFILLLSAYLAAEDRFMISLTGSALFPADSGYKDTYGKYVFIPELKACAWIVKGLYLWAGYGYLSKNGQTPILQLEASSRQHFISLGAGYGGKISARFGYQLELGVTDVSYTEESMGEKVTGSTVGFRINGGLNYKVGKHFLLLAELGYIRATDTFEDNSFTLGGFKAGVGIGIRF